MEIYLSCYYKKFLQNITRKQITKWGSFTCRITRGSREILKCFIYKIQRVIEQSQRCILNNYVWIRVSTSPGSSNR